MSKGCMPHNHRLYLGMLGIHGFPAAGAAIRECDVLLALGARFSDRVMEADGAFASKAKIIHVDIDPAEISKNINAHIPIVGDVKMVLEEMLARLEESALTAEWLEILEHYKNDNKAVYNSAGKKGLNAFKIIKSVSALAGENAIVCTDVGQHQMAAAQFFPLKRPGGFLTSGGLGTMGYGVPAAIGAQLAAPCDTVICFSGDGSLQMSFNELAVVKAHNLPLKIVLLNNSCLGLVRQLQHSYYGGRYFAVDMEGNPDFVALAAAYGIDALKINAENELDYALEKAFASPKPYLLDCAVSKEDLIFSGLTPSDKNM
jgi:acetolactate synthase-1/2/3 large subunit